MERIGHPQKLGDKLTDPDRHDASFVALLDGWAEDLERLHGSLVRHLRNWDWELVVVDNQRDDDTSQRAAALEHVVHLPLRDPMGWAAARNFGLRQASGRLACIVDTSVELTGDALEVVERDLADPSVGLVGRWGVVTRNGFDFEDTDGPDVDGVEAYFMAARRGDVHHIGLFDPKFKWYRNADIDFTFRVRDAGLRTIVDASLPLERYEHRLWATTPDTERDEMSRKNFFRFRDHWGDRRDLFVALES
jgi:glycosyltransferase involved in cell wall biosynthesis